MNFEWPYMGSSSDISSELQAFKSGDIKEYFDIMSNLEDSCDENGVVRLFPYYSNGKGYSPSGYSHGGRDALRMVIDKGEKIPEKPSEKKLYESHFMYYEEVLYKKNNSAIVNSFNNDNYLKNLSYGVLSNVTIDSSIKSIEFRVDACGNSMASWNGSWNIHAVIEGKAMEYFLTNLGEGFYNFYFFVGNCERDELENGSAGHVTRINGSNNSKDISTIATDPNNSSTINEWSKLKGKSLFKIGTSMSGVSTQLRDFLNDNGGNNNYSPICICYEKVSDPKIYKNFGESFESEEELDKTALGQYDTADNFVHYSNPIKKAAVDTNKVDPNDTSDIREYNPYVYYASNIDFTAVDEIYLNFRLDKKYSKLSKFDINYSSDICIDPNEDGSFDSSQRFVPASEYIEDAILKVGSGEKYFERPCFKLIDETYKGKYDIILIKQHDLNSEGQTVYNVFAYRHTINFIKIFADSNCKELAEKSKLLNIDDDGFVIHYDRNTNKEFDTLLWKEKFNIGDYLTPASKGYRYENGEQVTSDYFSVEEVLLTYISEKENVSDVSETFKSKYYLRDYVSDAIVMAYNDETHQYEMDTKILKNYIFYVCTRNI